MSPTLVVTGAGGQLGSELLRLVPDAVGLTRAELDVTDPAAVAAVLRGRREPVVVNCAAFTAVDAAESRPAEAFAVNAAAPGVLATALAGIGGGLVHVSTDYVFDGSADRPYEVSDPPGPLNVYGASKLAGERAVRDALPDASWVVRTSWLYGTTGANFVTTMVRLATGGGPVDVVDDQRGAPTWAGDLAAGLLDLVERRPPAGVYHAVGGGETSWFGFAQAIFAVVGADPGRVRPVSSADRPRPARRPASSVLSDRSWRAAGLAPLRPWPDALRAALGS